MSLLLDALGSAADLVLIVLGFSLIIVIHEAGHFFAAKWAGIRVLAFAIGFGPAAVSFRKGMGARRGSSEAAYLNLLKDAQSDDLARRDAARARLTGISTTEYRLNLLPLGGYVKMLGQDDADPGARSSEPDSYQNCPPLKRMVVISAGVIANIVTAAIAFVLVFTIGLTVEPAVVGDVEPGSPAARAQAVDAQILGITEPGLRTGDTILSVNGDPTLHFNDLRFKVAYAAPKTPVTLRVQRPGIERPLEFSILPEPSSAERLLSIGVGPAASAQLPDAPSRRFRSAFAKVMKYEGYDGIQPGMRLTAINAVPTDDPYAIRAAANASAGKPVTLEFTGKNGEKASIVTSPRAVLQRQTVKLPDRDPTLVDHLLGLTPVLAVRGVVPKSEADAKGVRAGDIFAKVGTVEYPSLPAGILEIGRSKGTSIGVVVLRKENDQWTRRDLGKLKVSSEGMLGFVPRDSAELLPIVASPWRFDKPAGSGSSLALPAGSIITRIGDARVESLVALRDALAASPQTADGPSTAVLAFRGPSASTPDAPDSTVDWTIPPAELIAVKALGWESPISTALFAPRQIALKADGVGQALQMGFDETHRTMAMTYLTFARLFQGTVKVDNLRGPVGIAHVGLSVADKGWVWLVFFFALISINLAVINFMPIPITDGGHMIFLIYEQLTGKMVSIAVQNVATIAGLAVIGSLFLYVTFHDVSRVVRDISAFLGG